MPRIVGDEPGYTFYLKRYDGKYDQDTKIVLPGVTSVIKSVLHSRALMHWHYTVTRDSIAGLIDHLWNNGEEVNLQEFLDVFSDPTNLEEYLKENKVRPNDIRDEAGPRGDSAHELLASLATSENPIFLAEKVLSNPSSDPFQRGVAKWWIEKRPVPVLSEKVVYCLDPGYAGSLDLVYEDPEIPRNRCLMDLKTRKPKRDDVECDMYESDEIQVAAYEHALSFPVERRSILIVRADESFDEYEATLPVRMFFDLLSVYNGLKER